MFVWIKVIFRGFNIQNYSLISFWSSSVLPFLFRVMNKPMILRMTGATIDNPITSLSIIINVIPPIIKANAMRKPDKTPIVLWRKRLSICFSSIWWRWLCCSSTQISISSQGLLGKLRRILLRFLEEEVVQKTVLQ